MSDDEVGRLLEMYPQEELCDELREHSVESAEFGLEVRHPLVLSVITPPALYGFLNRALRLKQQELKRALASEDWSRYVFLHERPWRVQALVELDEQAPGFKDADYWCLVGQVWTDTENAWEMRDWWDQVLASDRGSRELVMNDDERTTLAGLEDPVVVYRGYRSADAVAGFSWTLSRGTAGWFARRFRHRPGEGYVATGTVARENVIALLEGRGEQEILVTPDLVTVTSVEEIE